MFASKFVLPAAWLLLLGTAAAVPAPPSDKVDAEQAENPMEPWVTVDAEGLPKTVTPVLTTIDGTRTIINAAPSTGTAEPAADNNDNNKNKAAPAITDCTNPDGEFAPFCLPKNNDIYYPGSLHYVTWDPDFFHGANTTVKIMGYYAANPNATEASEKEEEIAGEEAFSSDDMGFAWGFYQWRLEKSLLSNHKLQAVNITLRMAALPRDGQRATWLEGPTIQLTYKPKPAPPPPPPEGADNTALFIVLPLVLSMALFIVVGTSMWNRQARHIDLGGLMRAARRKSGTKSSRSRRERHKGKGAGGEEAIRLMERDGFSSGEEDGGWAGKKRLD